jgi:hypothetical protein
MLWIIMALLFLINMSVAASSLKDDSCGCSSIADELMLVVNLCHQSLSFAI